jgi:adenine phosphoribosyltransferase
LAARLDKNIVLIRKAGKLPPPIIVQTYQLEYGSDQIEIKKGIGNVLLVDDVLATGGTFAAAASLCEKAGYNVRGFLTLIDLQYLNKFEWNGMIARSLIQYL